MNNIYKIVPKIKKATISLQEMLAMSIAKALSKFGPAAAKKAALNYEALFI